MPCEFPLRILLKARSTALIREERPPDGSCWPSRRRRRRRPRIASPSPTASATRPVLGSRPRFSAPTDGSRVPCRYPGHGNASPTRRWPSCERSLSMRPIASRRCWAAHSCGATHIVTFRGLQTFLKRPDRPVRQNSQASTNRRARDMGECTCPISRSHEHHSCLFIEVALREWGAPSAACLSRGTLHSQSPHSCRRCRSRRCLSRRADSRACRAPGP